LIKVLLVDDEPLIRKVFCTKIDWEKYDMNIVGECPDGLRAVEYLHNHKVDLVITDIKMPRMDGNELIEMASVKFPHIKFAVLSSYSDFHLVTRAFKGGVLDYILKEDIGTKQMDELLERLRQMIIDMNHNHQRVVERTQLKDYLTGKILQQNVLSKDKKYIMFQIKVKQDKLDPNKSKELINTISDYLQNKLNILFSLILDIDNYFSVIIESIYFSSSQKQTMYYNHVANEILRLSSRITGIEICVGYSRCWLGDCVREAWKATTKIADLSFYMGFNRVYTWLNIENFCSCGNIDLTITKDKYLNAINNLNISIVKDIAQEFFADCFRKRINKETLASYVFELHYFILINLYDKGIMPKDMREMKNGIYREIDEKQTFEELKKWFLMQMDNILNIYQCSNLDISEKARLYAAKNFSDNLSLNDVANHLNVSSEHLSRIFSDKMGISFTQYMIDFRIKKAQKYLINTRMSINEISKQVGFNSAEHFCRCFKKVTGNTPTHYRKTMSNKLESTQNKETIE
jgi:two-component system response regulator YesN